MAKIIRIPGDERGPKSIDRTSINSWEDEEFVAAVKATGRKKLIMCALWTEARLSFPALNALGLRPNHIAPH